ncbi:methyltransferase type 11 (plasmid) [Arthrobacter sp. ERGS1:01]|uniref:class I SAM-dependent methyltransferase n=1 Tax=Arthrobacter sp. ERGS1:01 TaxID=1704044 RepID=UPI0006B52150|nr:class I SAM-dependent methyltransferase [Arthrobacter sp. ERGS1:01]ALE04360.1 methyltransferase type 11 [Arthrobacter sp. ERGS1:01]
MVPLPLPVTPADDASHRHRELAESFGKNAERYDRTRPHYPTALVDAIADRMQGRSILDVGIGTGISAEPFRDRGFAVHGIEPDLQMAELARAKGFVVEIARFEEWEAAGQTFDAIIAGQTWHWVDPTAGAAKAASVLPPGGSLALFWNSGRPSGELAAEFAAVFSSLNTGLPFNPWAPMSGADPYGTIIDAAAAGLRTTGAFGELERFSFNWQATATRDAWLEQTSTAGGINRLPKDKLDALLNGMGAAIDAAGGNLTIDYTTVAAISERQPTRHNAA